METAMIDKPTRSHLARATRLHRLIAERCGSSRGPVEDCRRAARSTDERTIEEEIRVRRADDGCSLMVLPERAPAG
jgi:hypothetical protein